MVIEQAELTVLRMVDERAAGLGPYLVGYLVFEMGPLKVDEMDIELAVESAVLTEKISVA